VAFSGLICLGVFRWISQAAAVWYHSETDEVRLVTTVVSYHGDSLLGLLSKCKRCTEACLLCCEYLCQITNINMKCDKFLD